MPIPLSPCAMSFAVKEILFFFFSSFFLSSFLSLATSTGIWQYFFALYVILIFTAIIGAAAAFSFWRLLRAEDEGLFTLFLFLFLF
jgi:membrane protein implicated in regulation of membrane protease activity